MSAFKRSDDHDDHMCGSLMMLNNKNMLHTQSREFCIENKQDSGENSHRSLLTFYMNLIGDEMIFDAASSSHA